MRTSLSATTLWCHTLTDITNWRQHSFLLSLDPALDSYSTQLSRQLLPINQRWHAKENQLSQLQNSSWQSFSIRNKVVRLLGRLSITYSFLCFDLFCLQHYKTVKSIFALLAVQTPCSGALKLDPEAVPEHQAPAYLPLHRAPGSPGMELLEMPPQSEVYPRTLWIPEK